MAVLAYRPMKVPFLTNKQKSNRLSWAKHFQQWSEEDWKEVSFSDESMIEICPSRCRTVRRSPGERLKPEHYDQRQGYPIRVMVWGCMSWRGLGRLAIVFMAS